MAEEEGKQLAFVPEIILKKRKSSEEWALKRKAQLELRLQKAKQARSGDIKMATDFIKEYRARELDLIKMKHRAKKRRPALHNMKSQLLFVVRIQGKNEMHAATKKILNSLRLRRVFNGIFVRANEAVMDKLQKVQPYVTYGYPNLKSVKDLVYKKGYAKIEKQRVPLTDNNIIEKELGKYGVLCLEDIVHEIVNVGPHFREVTSFLWPFSLNKPEGDALKSSKRLYKDGGDTGNREDDINELISKMN